MCGVWVPSGREWEREVVSGSGRGAEAGGRVAVQTFNERKNNNNKNNNQVFSFNFFFCPI